MDNRGLTQAEALTQVEYLLKCGVSQLPTHRQRTQLTFTPPACGHG